MSIYSTIRGEVLYESEEAAESVIQNLDYPLDGIERDGDILRIGHGDNTKDYFRNLGCHLYSLRVHHRDIAVVEVTTDGVFKGFVQTMAREREVDLTEWAHSNLSLEPPEEDDFELHRQFAEARAEYEQEVKEAFFEKHRTRID